MIGKKRFVCRVCGYVSPKWEGRCPECGEWESLVERMEEKRPQKRASLSTESSQPRTLEEIGKDKEERFKTGIGEFDRMLGGGIVPGSVTLVGGEPGIGKSTFLLEVAQGLSSYRFPILYVSGEESLQQTGIRAARLGINSPLIYLIAENSLDAVEKHVEKIKPRTLIVDSIQTVYLDEVDSSPGSVSQVRECTLFLVRMAKREQIAVFLVGHVTKDGSIAGPKIMEHMVDTVLYFESSRDYQYRILRATKNRFGPTSEVGIFKMGEKGLLEVQDVSTLFISDAFLKDESPGAAIVPTVEGSRVFLIEIQALVDRSNLAIPRRIAQGIDYRSAGCA
ncbi:DNA repair protein RadA, partial [Candidatus Aerophobetes bacterium]|nr:DNA repair protein RadA [Candidatus Aerophobetes bacterium]